VRMKLPHHRIELLCHPIEVQHCRIATAWTSLHADSLTYRSNSPPRTCKVGRERRIRRCDYMLYCCGREGAGPKLDDPWRRGRRQGWRVQCSSGGGDDRGGATGWEVLQSRPPGELFLHPTFPIDIASRPVILHGCRRCIAELRGWSGRGHPRGGAPPRTPPLPLAPAARRGRCRRQRSRGAGKCAR
jgi:hypothetical protein